MQKKSKIERKILRRKKNSVILECTSTENLRDKIKYCNDSFFLYNQWWKERLLSISNKDSEKRMNIYEERINELGKTIFDYYRS